MANTLPQRQKRSLPESLTFKVGVLATLIMVIVLVVFSTVIIVSERQKARDAILETGKTFAIFSAQAIYDNYVAFYTHPQPEDFENFKARVQAILDFNRDIQSVSLMGLSGRVLFDTSEFTTGKYSGPARTIEDKTTIAALLREDTSTRQIAQDGEDVVEIVVPLSEQGGGHILSMRYMLSFNTLSERMIEVYQRSAVIAAILLAFAVALATLLSLRLTRPIVRLTKVAQQIQAGNFDARAVETSADEIGSLSKALNDMATDLKGYYEDLEAKVRERTKALEEAEVKLSESVKKNEALLASIGDGVIATDKNGRIVLINKVAEDMAQIVGADVMGKPYSDVWGIETSPGQPLSKDDQDPIDKALNSGVSTRSSKYSFARRDAQGKAIVSFPAAVSVSPVTLKNQIAGAIAVIRDITHEKEVDRMKTEFISLASHQLRTPLSAIKWFTEMLLSGDAGKLNPDQTEFARNVSESTERMIDLVRGLLNISRMESGRILIDPKPTNLHELIKGIVDDVQAKIKENNQTMHVAVSEDLPLVNLDERLISQVYMNLLTNAIKYTPKKGKISVLISQKGNELVSQVSDTGYGIPKSEQHKIFQKFFRAENVVKIITDGTGLGLYLVKAIIESSGGKIWFESEEGKGTSFWFSLPIEGMKPKAGEVTIDG
jgi:PAS domain S-box-containing protein